MGDYIISDTGKTVEDYRLIIQKLKSKLKNTESRNQSLAKSLKALKTSVDPSLIQSIL